MDGPLQQTVLVAHSVSVTDTGPNAARDRFLDRYNLTGEEREAAARDLQQFAEVMIRVASRLAREQVEDSHN